MYQCTSLAIDNNVVRLNEFSGAVVAHCGITLLKDDDIPTGWIHDGTIFTTRYRLGIVDFGPYSRLTCMVHVDDLY